jgi:hypothetical protein
MKLNMLAELNSIVSMGDKIALKKEANHGA